MGGFGSGRRPNYQKLEAESLLRLDMRELSKLGYLATGYSGTITWSSSNGKKSSISFSCRLESFVLNYRVRERDDDWESINQTIGVLSTECHFGGERSWWVCGNCQRRKLVLYLGGKYFYCRDCLGVTYSSQGYDMKNRLQAKAAKIKDRLGIEESWNIERKVYHFDRPKGMHQKTFSQLMRTANESIDASESLWDERFKSLLAGGL